MESLSTIAMKTYPDHAYPQDSRAHNLDASTGSSGLDDFCDTAAGYPAPETYNLRAPVMFQRRTVSEQSFSSLPQALGALNSASLLSSLSSCASLPSLSAVLQQIRDDSWNGRGPGEYILPGVHSIDLGKNGGSLPTLLVNAKPVGYLHGGSDSQALALKPMLNGAPTDIKVKGHYGNTTYYIDRIEMATPPSPNLAAVISQIRADAWHGQGPGTYVLPGVQSIFVDRSGSSLPTLMVNAKTAGYLHGGSDATADALAQMLANKPHDIAVKGHYGNTVFYIDGLEIIGRSPKDALREHLEAMVEDKKQGTITRQREIVTIEDNRIDVGGVKLERHD